MLHGFRAWVLIAIIFSGCALRGDGRSLLGAENTTDETPYTQTQTTTSTSTISTTLVTSTTTSSSTTFSDSDVEPEVTLFDLYLSDNYQGLVLVRYTDEWFEVDSPKELVNQLPVHSNQEAVEELVRGRIFRERANLGVGSIIAHVNTFRIVVNLDSTMLPQSNLELKGALPDPLFTASLRQDVSAAFAGDVSEQLTGAWTHRTIASYGRFWGTALGTFVEGEDYEADEYSLNAVYGTTKFSSGLLQTEGQRFAGSADFMGLSIRTEEQVLVNQDTLRGNRIQVFVPSRSRVEYYRAGRLLDVQILDFGLQEVDSSRFPQGSYEVEMVIREDSGNITRQSTFFTKSGRLAVRDIPVFNLQAGVLRDEFNTLSTGVYQADLTWRALSFLQLQGGATGADDLTIGYASVFAVIDNYFMGAGYHLSNEGNSAVNLETSGMLGEFNFSMSYSGSIKSEDRSGSDDSRPIYFPGRTGSLYLSNSETAALKVQDINSIAYEQKNFLATISRQFNWFEFRISASEAERDGQRSRRAYGPTLVWWAMREATQSFRMELSHFDTEDGDRSSLFAVYTKRLVPWAFGAQGRVINRPNETESRTIGTIDYDTRSRSGKGTRAQVRGEMIRDDQTEGIGSALVNHAAPLIAGSGFAQRVQSSANARTSVGATVDSSMLLAGQDLHLSYPTDGQAVILATLEGNGATEPVQLLVNDSPYELLTPGKTLAIGLPAFRTYRVRIKPRSRNEIVDYDNEEIVVTLFPGNIVKKTWSVHKIFIGIGRLLDTNGKPLANVHLKGFKEYSATDNEGNFQAEMTGKETVTVSSRGEEICTLKIPEIEQPEYYFEFGDLKCLNRNE